MKKENVKHKIPKSNSGITLIALVITIIVLLILAMVSISLVLNTGIISHAKNATDEYAMKSEQENTALEGYLAKIEEIVPGENGGTQVNDEQIAQLLTNWIIEEQLTDEELTQQLEQQLSIEDDNVVFSDIAIIQCPTDNIMEDLSVYIYKIDRLYKIDNSTNTFIYAKKEQNLEEYAFAQNVKELKVELERIFFTTTVSDIIEKYDAGELISYVEGNSEKITNIDAFTKMSAVQNILRIGNLTFVNGDECLNIGEDYNNYTLLIANINSDEKYNKVIIEWRNLK